MARLDHILDRKMSRKEFLATLGLSGLSILGISSVISILGGKHTTLGHPASTVQAGFGYGAYGGGVDTAKTAKLR